MWGGATGLLALIVVVGVILRSPNDHPGQSAAPGTVTTLPSATDTAPGRPATTTATGLAGSPPVTAPTEAANARLGCRAWNDRLEPLLDDALRAGNGAALVRLSRGEPYASPGPADRSAPWPVVHTFFGAAYRYLAEDLATLATLIDGAGPASAPTGVASAAAAITEACGPLGT